MNINGKQLAASGIITGEIPEGNIAQHGIDLNVVEIRRIENDGSAFIPDSFTEKTVLCKRIPMEPEQRNILGKDRFVWILEPGTYDITFLQGCKIPADQRLEILHRSSVLRNGNLLHSAVFDAGFETDRMGTLLIINNTMMIEMGARIAQILAISSNTVTNTYSGQYQKDAQRVDGREGKHHREAGDEHDQFS